MAETSNIIDNIARTGTLIAGRERWPRILVTLEAWQRLYEPLSRGDLDLVALGGEADHVHLVVREGPVSSILSRRGMDGAYQSLGRRPKCGQCLPYARSIVEEETVAA